MVAADLRILREGLEGALRPPPDIGVVGRAASMYTTLKILQELKPDICLFEAAMPDSRRLARCARDGLDTKLIVVGIAEGEKEVLSWAREGIAGFVTRGQPGSQLPSLIRMVARGEWNCSPRMTARLLRACRPPPLHGGPSGIAHLTERQLQVATCIAIGQSNKEIALELGICVSTVKNHVHTILTKLGLHRRGQVAERMRHHLAELDAHRRVAGLRTHSLPFRKTAEGHRLDSRTRPSASTATQRV